MIIKRESKGSIFIMNEVNSNIESCASTWKPEREMDYKWHLREKISIFIHGYIIFKYSEDLRFIVTF